MDGRFFMRFLSFERPWAIWISAAFLEKHPKVWDSAARYREAASDSYSCFIQKRISEFGIIDQKFYEYLDNLYPVGYNDSGLKKNDIKNETSFCLILDGCREYVWLWKQDVGRLPCSETESTFG